LKGIDLVDAPFWWSGERYAIAQLNEFGPAESAASLGAIPQPPGGAIES
jgi:hypothetical protein